MNIGFGVLFASHPILGAAGVILSFSSSMAMIARHIDAMLFSSSVIAEFLSAIKT